MNDDAATTIDQDDPADVGDDGAYIAAQAGAELSPDIDLTVNGGDPIAEPVDDDGEDDGQP